LNFSYKINEGFSKEKEENINLDIHSEISVGPGTDENSSVVILKITIGSDDNSAPFYIYAEEGAAFRWDAEKINDSQSEKLLRQNAPALLLSYLRPTIAMITAASPFPSYNIPFMNFTE
jgi:preprotein translocase subunit SecB